MSDKTAKAFPARFAGVCPRCNGTIKKGEAIVRSFGHDVHDSCERVGVQPDYDADDFPHMWDAGDR